MKNPHIFKIIYSAVMAHLAQNQIEDDHYHHSAFRPKSFINTSKKRTSRPKRKFHRQKRK